MYRSMAGEGEYPLMKNAWRDNHHNYVIDVRKPGMLSKCEYCAMHTFITKLVNMQFLSYSCQKKTFYELFALPTTKLLLFLYDLEYKQAIFQSVFTRSITPIVDDSCLDAKLIVYTLMC